MAPAAPLGRQRAIDLALRGKLPAAFGSPHPTVAIVEQDGRFRLRELVVDAAEAEVDRQRAFAAGRSWMPEHHYALGKPTGTIYAEAPTRDQLAEIMRTMHWTASW